ncbi:MAG: WhiB family transcriptional regulator, partial [Streptosporangiaceae bacterium]
MTRAADIAASRCGAPCAGRWCVLRAGHKLGPGISHRATPRTSAEQAAARAFAAGAAGRPPLFSGAALCAEVDPDLFFAEPGTPEEAEAKEICGQCQIREECLQWALAHWVEFGVWGGTGQADRDALRVPHGTPARYDGGPDEEGTAGKGCRCRVCKLAHRREAEQNRVRLRASGKWQPWVDSGPARAHVRMLMAFGIGCDRVAALAGPAVSAGAVSALIYGHPPGPPSRKIRPEAEAAILAVQPVLENLAATALVDPTGTRRRLQALVAAGWPQRRLAARLGWRWSNFYTVMAYPKQIAAATARAVIALYCELRDQPPPQATQAEKTAMLNARALAETRGWPGPDRWDDGTIDDPRAAPRTAAGRPQD